MSGLYNGLISDNPNVETILETISLTSKNIDRFRDVDVPPFKRFRQLPLFTDEKFANEEVCKDRNSIVVLTRIGGANRNDYKNGWDQLRNHPNYISDYDCSFDNTYAYIEFNVDSNILNELKKLDSNPEPDIEKIIQSNMGTAKMISQLTGEPLNEKDLYDKCKKIAWELVRGK